MNLIQRARERMRRKNIEWILESARWEYYLGDTDKAILLLMEIDEEVIQEPPFNSEEYRNGERKPSKPDDEQEQEEEDEYVYITLDDPLPDRDDDGYLIR